MRTCNYDSQLVRICGLCELVVRANLKFARTCSSHKPEEKVAQGAVHVQFCQPKSVKRMCLSELKEYLMNILYDDQIEHKRSEKKRRLNYSDSSKR